MPAKKKPRPLIAEERRNMQLRTQARIATLLAASITPYEARIPVPVPIQQSGLSLNVFVMCVCSLLLTLNLMFVLWAYIQITIHVKQV